MTLILMWERLLDSIDSSGGHLVLLFALMLVGIGMEHWHLAKGEDVLVASFGALMMGLRPALSNLSRRTDPPALGTPQGGASK